MSRLVSIALGTALLATTTGAGGVEQPPKTSCIHPVSHQFDFWIGRWDLTENGKPAGTNHMVSAV